MPSRIRFEIPRRCALRFWRASALIAAVLVATSARAQSPDLRQVVERLDRLETQNQQLLDEVRSLKEQLAALAPGKSPQAPAVEERLEVQESRTAEQAQSKVEAAHRFPIRITGMALFNTFLNSQGSGAAEYSTVAVPASPASGGATFRQTIIGLDYDGPRTFGGGKIGGSLRMDLFGGAASGIDPLLRLRTASVGIDWTNSSFMAGVEKPLISPREPDSLAQVAVSPLAGAGNLWYWVPQARFSQTFRFGEEAGIRAQVAVLQTHEINASLFSPYSSGSAAQQEYAAARPGIESRLEFFTGKDRRIEVAPGIHHSVSHIDGASAPSDIYTLDWLIRPAQPFELTGAFFTGRNVAPLGTAGIRQGVVLISPGNAVSVPSVGGWGQLTYRAAPRLWFNFFSGQQDDRNSGLPAGAIGKNLAYGGNAFLRLAPNVLASFELSQTRTAYIGGVTRLYNHYDLAFAYLF